MGIAGDNVGVLLRGVDRNEIERGQVLAKPRFGQAAQEVRSQSLRALKGRGRPAHAVLRETIVRSSTSAPPTSPAPSSCPKALRWSCRATTCRNGRRTDHADRVRRGPSLRHPRGQQNSSRRRRNGGFGVTILQWRYVSSRVARRAASMPRSCSPALAPPVKENLWPPAKGARVGVPSMTRSATRISLLSLKIE